MAISIPRVAVAAIYVSEARFEFVQMLRMPGFVLPTLLFPLAFYVLFGFVLNFGGGAFAMSQYLMVSYGVFGVIGPALFGFGAGVANERSHGWLLLKQALPMPLGAYFVAKMAMSVLFALIICAGLFTVGAIFGGVEMSPSRWLILVLTVLLGTLPFCAMGLLVGSWVGDQVAVAVVNLIYLPMAVLSGLWFPLQVFPPFLQTVAWALPPFHLVQLALKTVAMDAGHPWYLHTSALAGYTLVFLWFAAIGFRREPGKRNTS